MTMLSPASEGASARKQGMPIKCFGHYVPLYKGERENLKTDYPRYTKALKHEKKAREKCARTCNDPKAFKKAKYNYLTSERCLLANMLEANKRRPYAKRLSLHEMIEASKLYKPMIELNEPVKVWFKPKDNGSGFRQIWDFGLVARGAHHMARKLLRMTYTPAEFQYTSSGVRGAVLEALRLINEEGYHYVAEQDIINHFASFDKKNLEATLPLPKGAVRQLVLALSAIPYVPSAQQASHILPEPTRSGIPPGSAASSEVAAWSVAHLKMLNFKNVVVINYADNFFLLAKTQMELEMALKALRLAIAKLPGGSFSSRTIKCGHVQTGFRMLGTWIDRVDGQSVARPTETALKKLGGRFHLERQKVDALLSSAEKEGCFILRLEGVQAYLRLRKYVTGWANAYDFCEDVPEIRGDFMYYLSRLLERYDISDNEIRAAYDPSVEVRITDYSD